MRRLFSRFDEYIGCESFIGPGGVFQLLKSGQPLVEFVFYTLADFLPTAHAQNNPELLEVLKHQKRYSPRVSALFDWVFIQCWIPNYPPWTNSHQVWTLYKFELGLHHPAPDWFLRDTKNIRWPATSGQILTHLIETWE